MDKGAKIAVLDHGYVALVDSMGTDASIVAAARMSTGKGFLGWGPRCTRCERSPESVPADDVCPYRADDGRGIEQPHDFKPGDEKLLAYLYENAHSTPFEFCQLVIEAQAPLFVLRQWHRHRVPFSYSELSGRYTEMPDLYYVPAAKRVKGKGKVNKQGSEGALDPDVVKGFQEAIGCGQDAARHAYQQAMGLGVSSELARINLPLSQYTRHRVSANLRGWLAFLKLRQDPHAQEEIRVYADAIAQIIASLWPRTFALYEEHTRHAVTLSRSEVENLREYMNGDATTANKALCDKLGVKS